MRLVVSALLFVLPGVHVGCKRDAGSREVPAAVLARIGTECLPKGGCGNGLACAGRINFAHVDAGFTCELVCDPWNDSVCPEKWLCVKTSDGRAAGLLGHCIRASEM